jgi:tetratricopeptide (TPR) repeat protein
MQTTFRTGYINDGTPVRRSSGGHARLAPVFGMLLIALSGALHAQPGVDIAELDALARAIAEQADIAPYDAQMVELLRRKIQLTEKAHGPTSKEVALVYYQLGATHSGRKEFPQAIAAIGHAVEIQENLSTPDDSVLSSYLSHLASAYADQRDWARAVAALERVITQKERDHGPESYRLVDTHHNMANALYMLGDSARAEVHLLRAWSIATERRAGHSLKGLAHSLHFLGEHYLRTGNAAKAVPLLERELAFLQQAEGIAPEKISAARELLDRSRRQAGTQTPVATSSQTSIRPAPSATVQAAGSSTAAKATSIWPIDMEPGNLYFVVEVPRADERSWSPRPRMVSAESATEAIRRVEQAHRRMVETTNIDSYKASRQYVVMDGGECRGPSWGAVVVNFRTHSDPAQSRQVWGGGCGKTPQLAIEAAFAACRKRDSQACDRKPGEDYWWGPEVSLALSGRSSWGGFICGAGMCAPSDHDAFGSFNVYTSNPNASFNHIQGMQDAISKLGKQCNGRPCYFTHVTQRCYDTTHFDQVGEKCTDKRLTPGGYSGSIRGTPAAD